MDNAVYKGEDVLRTRTDMVIEIKRGDFALRFDNTRISYVGMESCFPRYFVLTSNESGAEKRVEGRVEDGFAHIETTLAGKNINFAEIDSIQRYFRADNPLPPAQAGDVGWR